ncbi:hypothetical protein AOXY_G22175 [Acipenser oxyrinchus oxyrinchus]|uniref:Uncharacterized protein n=1 Tax=Acipenser oxyrinchus oxyrinchus TaxID=40147 RepID=A0AAD8FXA0_ACIOX|nr:hypothetical protein AOXY_G22175 [Acipenser oxyrinchus oxyrinchus]
MYTDGSVELAQHGGVEWLWEWECEGSETGAVLPADRARESEAAPHSSEDNESGSERQLRRQQDGQPLTALETTIQGHRHLRSHEDEGRETAPETTIQGQRDRSAGDNETRAQRLLRRQRDRGNPSQLRRQGGEGRETSLETTIQRQSFTAPETRRRGQRESSADKEAGAALY